MADDQNIGAWHLDKRIPIALIFTIIAQTVLAVWWISGIVHRLDTATEINGQQSARITVVEANINNQAVVTATAAAQMAAVRESLAELKAAQAETNRLLRELATEGARP